MKEINDMSLDELCVYIEELQAENDRLREENFNLQRERDFYFERSLD